MAREIPLTPGVAHQSFSVGLGVYTLSFRFDWVTRFQFFRVKITDITSNPFVVSESRSANLNVNLLRGFSEYGQVYMTGEPPTVENLGVNAKLMWEAPDNA